MFQHLAALFWLKSQRTGLGMFACYYNVDFHDAYLTQFLVLDFHDAYLTPFLMSALPVTKIDSIKRGIYQTFYLSTAGLSPTHYTMATPKPTSLVFLILY